MPESRAAAECFVRSAYIGLLKREPDEPAFSVYVNQLLSGERTEADLLAFFASLTEFFQRVSPENSRHAIAALYAAPDSEFGDPYRWVDGNTNLVVFQFPKTAGISLRKLIASYFHPLQLGQDGGVDRFTGDCPMGKHQRFFCWHMSWEEYSTIPFPKVTITCLREPQARLMSLYHFLKAIHESAVAPFDVAAKAAFRSADNFFEPKEPTVTNVVDNFYVRYLAGAYATADGDPLWKDPEANLNLAITRILEFDGIFFLEELCKTGGDLPERITGAIGSVVGRQVHGTLPSENVNQTRGADPQIDAAVLGKRTELDGKLYRRVADHLGVDLA